jgi:hypothetical protein
LYPVPYRVLDDQQQFGRWEWIKYDYARPKDDRRVESQKVVPESIEVTGTMRVSQRAKCLNPLIRASSREADLRGESLALVRPRRIDLAWRRKSTDEVADEARKHSDLVAQTSFLQNDAKPLTPCPYEFTLAWTDADGVDHTNFCDDWETSTAFFVRRAYHGELGALDSLKETYERDYVQRGLALAIGTHSRRNNQWLLVGIIRVDDVPQLDLLA